MGCTITTSHRLERAHELFYSSWNKMRAAHANLLNQHQAQAVLSMAEGRSEAQKRD